MWCRGCKVGDAVFLFSQLPWPSSGSMSQEEICWFSAFTQRVCQMPLVAQMHHIWQHRNLPTWEINIDALHNGCACPSIYLLTNVVIKNSLWQCCKQKCLCIWTVPGESCTMHCDGLRTPCFISWGFEWTGFVLQYLRKGQVFKQRMCLCRDAFCGFLDIIVSARCWHKLLI